ncbi:hypothetical protein JCM6882_004253 [Rhodosporidiobolus microsporus]
MMSASSSDARGHYRQDSIASKRVPTSARLAGSPRKGGEGGVLAGGGVDRRGGSAPSGGALSIPPKLAVRVVGACVALFLLLHFSHPLLFGDSLAAQAKERKTRMQGAGESWMLPRKWRHVQAGEGEVTEGGETLPECKRVMLFKFSDTHGFSSELLHYLRALVISQKLGYTLLADDSSWNYGSLTDFFLPRLVYCRPPSDWFDTAKAVKVGTRRWQGRDRVWVGREREDEADEWIRDEMLDPHAVDELRNRPTVGRILPEGESLPPAFEEVFADFGSALKEVWRPNDQLSILIRKQRMELGLGGGGLRHRKHSPTWGGNRRAGARARTPEEEEQDEEEWEFEINERSDRGPVIGVHLAGEKPRVDLSPYGLDALALAGNLSAVYEGAADAVRRLSHSSIASPSYSRTRPTLFPSTATPTLVGLTSNTSLFNTFLSHPSGISYNTLRTSSPPTNELMRWNDVLRLELTEDIPPPVGEAAKILSEWDQGVWNAELPRGLRVLLARYFVRDLTTLSLYSDAFVVSGASPTGRLALLLSGEDGAIGPRDFHGGSFGGHVRSVDGWWIPTSKVEALWG